ncbi:hypothetical protein B0T09DRAFT_112023 [Sordaria sp. MPI-SDFR-AT-0083]|nr:hypothetical protein B0T09DRAFT_112023 [Sordaria sp. MPI-SDFR-AT-0083]
MENPQEWVDEGDFVYLQVPTRWSGHSYDHFDERYSQGRLSPWSLRKIEDWEREGEEGKEEESWFHRPERQKMATRMVSDRLEDEQGEGGGGGITKDIQSVMMRTGLFCRIYIYNSSHCILLFFRHAWFYLLPRLRFPLLSMRVVKARMIAGRVMVRSSGVGWLGCN